jgi:hypothetical protein
MLLPFLLSYCDVSFFYSDQLPLPEHMMDYGNMVLGSLPNLEYVGILFCLFKFTDHVPRLRLSTEGFIHKKGLVLKGTKTLFIPTCVLAVRSLAAVLEAEASGL